MKIEGYSIGIAQIDDELEDILNFRICPNSNISLLVSSFNMSDMRCCSIGGMKTKYDAI